MPYLNVRISMKESPDVAEKIVSTLMKHTTELLGKKPEVISVAVDFVSPELWFVGGSRVSEQHAVTIYMDIKVTEGTNTKAEKAKYVREVFSDFESIMGPITPASYIVIHDIGADSWGFQGKTQEYRFIQAQSL
jgi:4-oxalocrotonate tautomerase